MKRQYILVILWGLWICSLIGMVFCVNWHIENKRLKLWGEIIENLDKLFEGQSDGDGIVGLCDGFFYEDFSGYPVKHYKKIPIPAMPKKSEYEENRFKQFDWYDWQDAWQRAVEDWQKEYSDLASLYELNWEDDYPDDHDEGWNIVRIYHSAGDIEVTTFFPYKVGLKKSEWGNPYSVERAVNDAFKYFATNAESPFAGRFQSGSGNRLWSKIYDCCNDYYTIENKGLNRTQRIGMPISWELPEATAPTKFTWVHNSYYRVYIAATQDEHFMVKEKAWVIKEDRKKFLLRWGVGMSVLFLSLIIPITIKDRKANQRRTESLYQRLLRLCNPKEFIRNYDKEKIDKVNGIYQRLMNTRPDDEEALMEILAVAVAELGITPYEPEELEELKEKVNPQNYFTPYDAEKIALANELYAMLTKNGLTYNEFMAVKEKSKLL